MRHGGVIASTHVIDQSLMEQRITCLWMPTPFVILKVITKVTTFKMYICHNTLLILIYCSYVFIPIILDYVIYLCIIRVKLFIGIIQI